MPCPHCTKAQAKLEALKENYEDIPVIMDALDEIAAVYEKSPVGPPSSLVSNFILPFSLWSC